MEMIHFLPPASMRGLRSWAPLVRKLVQLFGNEPDQWSMMHNPIAGYDYVVNVDGKNIMICHHFDALDIWSILFEESELDADDLSALLSHEHGFILDDVTSLKAMKENLSVLS